MRHAAPPKHSAPKKSTGFPKAAAFAGVGLLAVCTVILFVLLIRFNVLPSTWLIVAGCVFVTASPELNREELRVLLAERPPILVPAFGRMRLMLLTHCPARTALGLRQGHAACALCDRSDPSSLRGKTLTDRTGAAYPLTRIRLPEGCRVALSNHLPTDLRTEVAREGWPQLWTLNAPLEGGSRTTGHWRRGVE